MIPDFLVSMFQHHHRMYPWLCLLALNVGHSSSQGEDIGVLGLDMLAGLEVPDTPKKWSPNAANYEATGGQEKKNNGKIVGNEKLEETRSMMTNSQSPRNISHLNRAKQTSN